MIQQHSAAETARLDALYGYDILDSDPEPRFDLAPYHAKEGGRDRVCQRINADRKSE